VSDVTFTRDEMLDLQIAGEEVNSWLLDKIVERLLSRTMWGT
jgi:hypothetical protein